MSQSYSIPSVPISMSNLFALTFWQNAALWMFIFSGWMVRFEPAPYELMFVVTLVAFLPGRLTVTQVMAPLVIFLLLYNAGGLASMLPVMYLPKTFMFFVISLYMAFTAMFFCFAVNDRPMLNMAIIKNAYIWAAVIASISGLIGYFDIAGMEGRLAPMSRAQGFFKDPNVMSTFIIPPAVMLIQGFLLGTQKFKILSLLALMIIGAGIFFAFSRGAWMNFIFATALMVLISFATAPTLALRSRIIIISILGFIAAIALMAFILSFPSVRAMFTERAHLINYYDAGEYGRFGNQLRSLKDLLISPNGLGPFQFGIIYGQDPHNVYLNAFTAYGWLGGISYFILIFSTLAIGWRAIMTSTPWQFHAIAIYACFISVAFQGVQIDTDHWRHFYLLLGILWGLYAASLHYNPAVARATN